MLRQMILCYGLNVKTCDNSHYVVYFDTAEKARTEMHKAVKYYVSGGFEKTAKKRNRGAIDELILIKNIFDEVNAEIDIYIDSCNYPPYANTTEVPWNKKDV